MRQAQSERERQGIHEEHHRQMQARAKERGVTLPDEPPTQGMHRGRGPGRAWGPAEWARAAPPWGKEGRDRATDAATDRRMR